MKEGMTELVFILDRSGSMFGLEKDTIEGFNSMIQEQKEEEGEAVVTTVLFDDRYELIHDRFPLSAVGEMTRKEYFVRGSTALLDAVGKTIVKIQNVQEHLPEEARAEKVITVIITDGLENSSREYSREQISQMITRQRANGWEFLFLGANMDAVAEAKSLGIQEERAASYRNDSQGVRRNYHVVGAAVSAMRRRETVGREWKKEIDEDGEERR